jgi:DNA-binding NtrC family response regulator
MKPSVLVADDDRLMVRTLCDVLRLRGFEARGVHSGEEAVAAVAASRWDAVLIDFRMSGITGAEASKLLIETQPGVPVILMTAYAASDLPADTEQCGVLRVLAKPFAPERLFEVLDVALAR